jgi:hypothetical protein
VLQFIKTTALGRLLFLVPAIILLVVTVAGRQAMAEEKAWVLQERTLPVPTVVSEARRDSIASKPQPNVAANTQRTTLKTTEEWVKFIAAADKAATAGAVAVAERLKVTI